MNGSLERNTLWRYTANSRGVGHIFRVVFECSTEIICVSENSPSLGFMGGNIVAGGFPEWAWLGDRFTFFRDFEFVAGNAYNYDRRKRR